MRLKTTFKPEQFRLQREKVGDSQSDTASDLFIRKQQVSAFENMELKDGRYARMTMESFMKLCESIGIEDWNIFRDVEKLNGGNNDN